MSEPKRHHFVTKAYLEGFVAADGSPLHVYQRNKPEFFPAFPINIAKIKNYYSQKRPDGTIDNKVETMLATNVEGPGIAVIRRLNADHYDISATARGQLAFLMAIQEYRVPWMREEMEGAMRAVQTGIMSTMVEHPSFLEERIAEFQAKGENETSVTADDLRHVFRSGQLTLADNPGASMWAMGAVAERLTRTYYEMKWTILESKTVPFVTSDCPVHRFYAPRQPERPYTGLADDRLQVRFPLSKEKMLVMELDLQKMEIWHKLKARGQDRIAERRRMAASQIRRREVDPTEVAELNAHTISMAARFAMAPVEMAEIPALFQGECQNIRQKVDHLPGGLIRMQTVYPVRKA